MSSTNSDTVLVAREPNFFIRWSFYVLNILLGFFLPESISSLLTAGGDLSTGSLWIIILVLVGPVLAALLALNSSIEYDLQQLGKYSFSLFATALVVALLSQVQESTLFMNIIFWIFIASVFCIVAYLVVRFVRS